VRHRLGIIVPGGWVSCADSGERPNQDGSGWYPSGAGQSPQWAQRRGGRARSEVDAAAHREPRGSVRRARPRRCCAMRRLAAPRLGQTSGSDSNSRGLIPPGQHGPERARRGAVLEAGARGGELTAVGEPVASATSRPKAMAAARGGAFGASAPRWRWRLGGGQSVNRLCRETVDQLQRGERQRRGAVTLWFGSKTPSITQQW